MMGLIKMLRNYFSLPKPYADSIGCVNGNCYVVGDVAFWVGFHERQEYINTDESVVVGGINHLDMYVIELDSYMEDDGFNTFYVKDGQNIEIVDICTQFMKLSRDVKYSEAAFVMTRGDVSVNFYGVKVTSYEAVAASLSKDRDIQLGIEEQLRSLVTTDISMIGFVRAIR